VELVLEVDPEPEVDVEGQVAPALMFVRMTTFFFMNDLLGLHRRAHDTKRATNHLRVYMRLWRGRKYKNVMARTNDTRERTLIPTGIREMRRPHRFELSS